MKKNLLSPRLILPLIVLLGVMVMGMRAADIWATFAAGKLSLNPALAADASSATKAAAPAAASPVAVPANAPSPVPPDTPTEPVLSEPPPDSDASPAEIEVLKQLSGRREELDKRAHDLDTREALVKITEQRVDQKIKELETLRAQLQSMINKASEAQQTQLDNLVKIYETMKPDDAARIFDTLDMPVLLGVIQQMKPKSTAPIMAKMTPEKAKEITVDLTRKNRLPQLK